MSKKEDRRIRKSKQSIERAIIELIDEKGFEDIGVNDIAERADISRGTFYLHYQDKFELFERLVDKILNELISAIELSNDKSRNGTMDKERYIRYFEHFQKHSRFYKAMFSYKGEAYFYNRFIDVLKKHFYHEIKELKISEEQLKVDKDFLIHFTVYAYFGVVKYWLSNDMSDSAESMGEQLNTLLCSFSRNIYSE
ncbi:AcrR family transcriptional regulator [Scopulibacillus daqui]|uniref:AcrR family transcriptional regulator n=1 Tax=Scopulibacillus daqui TaxID=1469162 RepID=A0ABS2Q158_9BACL|nr:TetR/AcrR family transcriptional regulator [Scopulibacillus daqui]MBM7645923.1 AcrR family transcriptional regulator [Scopulibacillus daqui]